MLLMQQRGDGAEAPEPANVLYENRLSESPMSRSTHIRIGSSGRI